METGGWLLIHFGVALGIVALFFVMTFQYIKYLAPALNTTLIFSYGTGLVASLIGSILYAFGPPPRTEPLFELQPYGISNFYVSWPWDYCCPSFMEAFYPYPQPNDTIHHSS